MITLLVGENSFGVQQSLAELTEGFAGDVERLDGTTVELHQIADIFMGATLFASNRMVVIRDLSQNTRVWPHLVEWLERASDDTHLILVETAVDKRTSVYKALKEVATVKEHPAWTERDRTTAQAWVASYAKEKGVALDRALATHLVERVGVDQWTLAHAVEKLALLDTVTKERIDDVIEASNEVNVFQLFDLALDGNRTKVAELLQKLALQEEPHRLFALLSSQALQLAAVAAAGEGDDPVKELGVAPFVRTKMLRHVKRLGTPGVRRVLEAFARADRDLKSSRGEPWMIIEKTLFSL